MDINIIKHVTESDSSDSNDIIGLTVNSVEVNYCIFTYTYTFILVKTSNGLLLVNKLSDDLTKYQISDDLKREEERLERLDEEFHVGINWEERKHGFDFKN